MWTRIESEAFIPLTMFGIKDKGSHVDFKSVRHLFAPYSPVILNDNGKKFSGFIVAKEYLMLKTDEGHSVQYDDNIHINDYGEVLTERDNRKKYGEYHTFYVNLDEYDYSVDEKEDTSKNNFLIYGE